jgi:hypothetical protein
MIMTTQTDRRLELRAEFDKVETILAATPAIDKFFSIPTAEFLERQRRTYESLKQEGIELGCRVAGVEHVMPIGAVAAADPRSGPQRPSSAIPLLTFEYVFSPAAVELG